MKATKHLILPNVSLKNTEDVIGIVHIANIFDMKPYVESEAPAVLSFADVNDIEIVLRYPRVFGDSYSVLIGYPGAEYTASFESSTSMLDKVSYDTLVLELNAAKRAEHLRQLERETPAERQARTLDRKDGTRKAFDAFEIADGSVDD